MNLSPTPNTCHPERSAEGVQSKDLRFVFPKNTCHPERSAEGAQSKDLRFVIARETTR